MELDPDHPGVISQDDIDPSPGVGYSLLIWTYVGNL